MVAGLTVAQPFACFAQNFALQVFLALRVGAGCPFLQELYATFIGQIEEVVFGTSHDRRGAGNGGVGVNQLGRRVDCAAYFTGVAVLVGCATLGALAFYIAIGQEHAFHRVVELFHRARANKAFGFQGFINALRKGYVFRGVGGVPVVELNVEAVQILRALTGIAVNERLGRNAFRFGLEHDRRAMGVVGTHKMHGVAGHAHGSNPDIGLDVFHDMADVK